MIDKEIVLKVIEDELEGSDLFFVDLKIGKDNKISVFIDGDNGVTIKNCIDLSRKIEGNLDREVEDFELSVFSAGVGEALKLVRQYIKNIGRNISITTLDDKKVEGELVFADENKLIVRQTPKRKKDNLVETEIAFTNVKEGKIIIIF
ncbi:MAG: ribosome assembly cofactor RimP [Bacteroidales bacterium]|nr:ribosome assembly cofactor RimP [Bacteroidales bacterium]MDD4001292.1 ribosome assembly cofactor RimP [Bacteroidales bacterium]MDD4528880.1 ribosome assembly cofactor RimP [Bacteroidales bacterium]MDD4829926.1 ribosome assembly cofactor RimP [Bacteroidales bacterium]